MYSASVSFSVSSAVFSACVAMILALVSVGQLCKERVEHGQQLGLSGIVFNGA